MIDSIKRMLGEDAREFLHGRPICGRKKREWQYF